MPAEHEQHEAPAEKPRRMTMGQVVEALLNRGGSEHSSVTLTRNAKGETQIVVVRTGDTGPVQTITDAEAAAVEVYDRCRTRYPSGGTNGATS
jgi:hypothetical protein